MFAVIVFKPPANQDRDPTWPQRAVRNKYDGIPRGRRNTSPKRPPRVLSTPGSPHGLDNATLVDPTAVTTGNDQHGPGRAIPIYR